LNNTTLIRLKLELNPVTMEALKVMKAAVERNYTLEEFGCPLDKEGGQDVEEINGFIKRNRKLNLYRD